jgi:hypothetical protein
MAATAIQITAYLSDIHMAQSKFMDKLVRREKLGYNDIFSSRVIATILNGYVVILTDYFSQATYNSGFFITTYNFFDEEEITDIMYRINKICDTDYYLSL